MKIIVTHESPDLDAVTSVWLIKRFLPGWEEASVQFVPAGERLASRGPAAGFPPASARPSAGGLRAVGSPSTRVTPRSPIEYLQKDEVIHVDTGLGPLDHHETDDQKVSAASRTFDFIKRTINKQQSTNNDKMRAIERMVRVVVAVDHFKEVFWGDAMADYHEFSLLGIIEGLKMGKPNSHTQVLTFTMDCLDSILSSFENRIWAEREIAQNSRQFKTRWGKGMGFETMNDTVLKLAQKLGYVVVVRKDPRKGYVRIKARPNEAKSEKVDLTLVYEKLRKMDPSATWFLHVSKKMLLNGSAKNPKMRPTRLSLDAIIEVLKNC